MSCLHIAFIGNKRSSSVCFIVIFIILFFSQIILFKTHNEKENKLSYIRVSRPNIFEGRVYTVGLSVDIHTSA